MTQPETTQRRAIQLAKDLLHRLAWDLETGQTAYPSPVGTPLTAPKVKPDETTRSPAGDEPSQVAPNATIALKHLRTEIGDCTRCSLHKGRTELVFGEGNPSASLVFVGEGPGRDEDQKGIPFVGAAGQLLDKIIGAMGLDRSDVYICNVVKCRPPNNRTPSPEEQLMCGKYLRAQLAILHPKVVVALGGTAAQFLIGVKEPMGRLRGRFHEVDGLKIMPTYHPAYLLRSPQAKRPVWEDMQMVMTHLQNPNPGGESNP